MGTDRKILAKGLRYMGWSLPLLFMGPTIINSSFKNQDHPFYIPVLGLGIIFCVVAIYLIFLGLKTVMKSLFG
ncbi:MAG: hypothetical protein BM557_11410 [Flavobacterium sp. MedPE-SWcel]|uniref:DUF6095 family protein n=1 Tax=uncultured Flavobacterium sp. TaxID=165435 RepID=UPI0009236261|nr:DUF6095 family protein [uncultured Flavobacterium sp.]OIQ15369.1 MAG: hypothetical protein BM557_11410 [Flavobacterium sp. MedPE-SWcel]